MSGSSSLVEGGDQQADEPVQVVDSLLKDWPLPQPGDAADKEERGLALVLAGSSEMPGAAVLAGIAALRAGAGKLVIGTAAGVASWVAAQVPEARVIALPETAAGGPALQGVAKLADVLPGARAVLIGPGMQDEPGTVAFVERLLAEAGSGFATPVLLDALAMNAMPSRPRAELSLVLTPHAGEMARLCGDGKEAVLAEPLQTARRCARRWNAVVALKGARTVIASPNGKAWLHQGGNAGLATSGSGDVLAGLICGILARGGTPEQATVWGVALHARAGDRLAARVGPLGYLARELAAEAPRVMQQLGG